MPPCSGALFKIKERTKALIELKGVSKIYRSGEHELRALDNVDISVEKGKFVVILGPSGAGKSTLLNILGGRFAFGQFARCRKEQKDRYGRRA